MEEGEKVSKPDYSMQYGFDKGYLKNKTVKVCLVDKNWNVLVDKSNKNNAHYGHFDGALQEFPMALNERGDLLKNPFSSEDEIKFFEHITGRVLDPKKRHDPNFWWFNESEAKIKLVIDATFKLSGIKYDLSNPEDVLRLKIFQCWPYCANSVAESGNRPDYKFVIVDEDYEDTTKKESLDVKYDVIMKYGDMRNSKDKKRDFLTLYILNNKLYEDFPDSVSEDALTNRISEIIETAPKKFLETYDDPKKEFKVFAIRAIDYGAISKSNVGTYSIPGLNFSMNWVELLEWLKHEEATQGGDFMKIKSIVDMNSSKTSKKNK